MICSPVSAGGLQYYASCAAVGAWRIPLKARPSSDGFERWLEPQRGIMTHASSEAGDYLK
jgi:hypothetical protein